MTGLTFQLDNWTAAERLKSLIAWLELESRTVADQIARVPDEVQRKDHLGRGVSTENARKRDGLEATANAIAHDIEKARCWLIECEIGQTFVIGMELALWLNRPRLRTMASL